MFSKFASLAALGAMAFASVIPLASGTPIYAIANDSVTLIRFDSATPNAITIIGNFSGATNNLMGLDFRPADGLLYGYSNITDSVYRVNTATGFTTLVSTLSSPTNTDLLGIDFNPTVDRLRIVAENDQNLRANVDTGATTVDGALAYAAGDPNFGVNATIIDAAYNNSDRDPITGTTLYYIDYALDTLVSTTNPNGGVLNTIGALGINTNRFTGFDIFSNGLGGNIAYASLTVGSTPSLYTINLATGAATLIGAINALSVYGLAAQLPAQVPEPGSMALLGLAAIAGALGRRRRV